MSRLFTILSLFLIGAAHGAKPNIILIYADDLGYGDVTCNGAQAGLTPHIDRLAKEGVNFLDAHCSAATCTPSRYSLLTGEYAFRHPDVRILRGNAKAAIQPGKPTMASMLKSVGYRTAVIGKWHLGLGGDDGIDWNAEVKPGPLEIGFDTSFLIPATGDRVPCVYLKNHRVVGLDPADPIYVSYQKGDFDGGPLGQDHPELLKMKFSHGHDQTIVNGISRIGRMRGGKKALWVDEDMADVITKEALSFIDSSKDQPFFLFFSFHDIHVPRVPHPRFVGKSGMGPRGDCIVQMDWCIGEVLNKLDASGLTQDTLVIFSSDNGPVLDDGYEDEAVTKIGSHQAAGPLRGGKYSNFEAGTRVPMMVRWPAEVKPGVVSNALFSQIDLYASLAKLTEAKLEDNAALDSLDTLDVLLGRSQKAREELVEQARGLSLRQSSWKYIAPGKGPQINKNTNTELGVDPEPQLYNLAEDLGETKNLATSDPERVKAMAARLQAIRDAGRTRP